MKLITRFSKKPLIACATFCALALGVFAGVHYSHALTDEQYKAYSDADIYFYSNDCVGGGKFGNVCGNSAEEKVWSILRQTLDPIHAAAAFGSIAHEGGFQPVKWEYGKVVDTSTCSFVVSWDGLYNGAYDGKYGVGSFGLTSGLSDYLHYVNDNAPDLLKYFKDPANTCISSGDDLAEEIGESEYNRLIDLEVNYFVNEWIPKYKGDSIYDGFLATTDLREAAMYWAHNIEVCSACGYDEGDSQLYIRADAAEDYYKQYKDFTCSSGSPSSFGSSSSSTKSTSSTSSSSDTSSSTPSPSSVSGKDIIWIGDSDSVFAGEDLIDGTFPGIKDSGGWGPSFGDSKSYVMSCKYISESGGCGLDNPSGLEILEKIISENGLRPYLVFALGGNGGWDETSMKKFLELIDGQDVQVVITTAKYRTVDYPEGNALARKTAEEHPNIYLADIAANYSDDYFSDNDIEFNTEGSEMFIRTIKETLDQAKNGDCTTGDFVWYPQYMGEYSGIEVEVKTSPDSSTKVKTTMGDIGCGPFSFAMMANMLLPQEITPIDTMKIAIDTDSIVLGGSIGTVLTKNLAEHYGMEWEKLDNSSTEASINDINKHLKEGWMIETAGGGSTPYTPGGHYVGIRGIDSNGKWLLADPGHSEDVSQQPWDPKDVVSAGMNIDNVYAFRTTGSTPCNVNMCKGDSGTGVEASKPIGPIHEDSSDVPCDPRTKDLGIRDDAYYNNQRYSIRLCSIPNIKMTGTQGDDGDDGYVHVNSRVSGAFYSLSEEHNKRCGNYLEAVDDYRTNAEQTAFYNAYLSGTGNLAAAPGSQFANHQGGLAIDFNTSTYCSSDPSVASGPNGWFEPDFLANFGLQDGRRFSSPENWHVDALED